MGKLPVYDKESNVVVSKGETNSLAIIRATSHPTGDSINLHLLNLECL